MSFIAKKHLPRRMFLRGMGVTVALPLLDSMVPAQTPLSRTAANPASRLSCIYVPHGADMASWTPTTSPSPTYCCRCCRTSTIRGSRSSPR